MKRIVPLPKLVPVWLKLTNGSDESIVLRSGTCAKMVAYCGRMSVRCSSPLLEPILLFSRWLL